MRKQVSNNIRVVSNVKQSQVNLSNMDAANEVAVKARVGQNSQTEDDRISLPSDLSEDVWGELPKYQALMHAEQMKKEKQDLKNKRNMVRETLDK